MMSAIDVDIDDDSGQICPRCGDEHWDISIVCDECWHLQACEDNLLSAVQGGSPDDLRSALDNMPNEHALLNEASDYLALGDLSEAAHRARLYVSPKFASMSECAKQYEAAMAEKRERTAA